MASRKPTNPVEFPSAEHLRAEEYPVQHLDNWWSIAAAKHVDVGQLIQFNFKTLNPEEINWYLHEKVGCRHKTPDLDNYIFFGDEVPGKIYIPRGLAPPPCPNDFSQSADNELSGALRTKVQSVAVAQRFFATVGAVGRTGRFIPTISDTKYWFAKLYEIITAFEISAAADFKEPGFVLHFIPIFYGMYVNALDAYTAGGEAAVSSPLWKLHFRSTGKPEDDWVIDWTGGVLTSIITGVTAHVRGDMATALAKAYRSYVSKYCLNPAPPFETYHQDFLSMGAVFQQGRTAAMSLVAALGPVNETGVAMGDAMGAGLDVNEVNRWRADAWAEAKKSLGQ